MEKRVLILFLVIVIAITLYTFYKGIQLKKVGKIDSKNLSPHKTLGRILFYFNLSLVLVLETGIRVLDKNVNYSNLLVFHVFMGIIYFVSLFLLNWPFNGIKSKHHGSIAYICWISFLFMMTTALEVINNLEI